MKCSAARTFLSQISDREGITPILPSDLDYLSTNGYVLKTTKEDHDKGVDEVARLQELVEQVRIQRIEERENEIVLSQDVNEEHSFKFHLEGKGKDDLREKVQTETATVSKEESEISAMESNVDSLIQEKSTIDRMVAYDGGYLSLTGIGTIVLNDLSVRDYRVADQEFSDFLTEIKATYFELRSIADRATWYATLIRPAVPELGGLEHPIVDDPDEEGVRQHNLHEGQSMILSTAIGLGKLQGDPNQIGGRFTQAFNDLHDFDSAISNKLMAAEIITAASNLDVQSLGTILKTMDRDLRKQDVPEALSAGVSTTIMAGRRFDGTYPLDRFAQFKKITSSFEAASILAVMNVPYDQLSSKFLGFGSMFSSWGYMKSEDTEIASAFLAIGELGVNEVQEKLKYIEDQLRNYLGYPMVAAAILASIPVFEAHEVLDLMEKAVTLLSGYTSGLERSELVALAVGMIHGVRNELVKQIDSTAKISDTPVQFTYSPHPGLFIWYNPVIVAHSYYHATFSGMGGFHPGHSHGVGGFAG